MSTTIPMSGRGIRIVERQKASFRILKLFSGQQSLTWKELWERAKTRGISHTTLDRVVKRLCRKEILQIALQPEDFRNPSFLLASPSTSNTFVRNLEAFLERCLSTPFHADASGTLFSTLSSEVLEKSLATKGRSRIYNIHEGLTQILEEVTEQRTMGLLSSEKRGLVKEAKVKIPELILGLPLIRKEKAGMASFAARAAGENRNDCRALFFLLARARLEESFEKAVAKSINLYRFLEKKGWRVGSLRRWRNKTASSGSEKPGVDEIIEVLSSGNLRRAMREYLDLQRRITLLYVDGVVRGRPLYEWDSLEARLEGLRPFVDEVGKESPRELQNLFGIETTREMLRMLENQ